MNRWALDEAALFAVSGREKGWVSKTWDPDPKHVNTWSIGRWGHRVGLAGLPLQQPLAAAPCPKFPDPTVLGVGWSWGVAMYSGNGAK
jgi:hypothetical protein